MFAGNETARSIASTVSALMKDKGLTQLQMVEATGIPRRTLQRYLSGEKPIHVDALAVIADALETTSTALFASAEAAA